MLQEQLGMVGGVSGKLVQVAECFTGAGLNGNV